MHALNLSQITKYTEREIVNQLKLKHPHVVLIKEVREPDPPGYSATVNFDGHALPAYVVCQTGFSSVYMAYRFASIHGSPAGL